MIVKIVHKAIEVAPVEAQLTYPDCGALVTFRGVTRNHHQGKKVLRLAYEAHETFALQELTKIREEMLSAYEIRDLALIHRLGEVPIGETSLLVVVASAHRAPALGAVTETIDVLKRNVPIWKKEFYEGGSEWIEPEEGCC